MTDKAKAMDMSDAKAAGVLREDHRMSDITEPDAIRRLANSPVVGDLIDKAFTTMRRRHRGEETPIPLPWPSLSTALGGGLWPGLTVLVGNTGTGKSQWALQATLYAARQQWPVLYVALELGTDDIVARLAGLVTKRRWSDLWQGKELGPPGGFEWALGQAEGALCGLPIRIEVADPYGWQPECLADKAKAMKEAHGRPPLIIIDYLQVVAIEGVDQRQAIGRAAYAARQAARATGAAVIMLSSTARYNYAIANGRDDKGAVRDRHPSELVGLGKESGEIEYGADNVLVLVKKPWDNGQPPSDGWSTMHVAVAKVRAGAPDWVNLRFNGGWFEDLDAEPIEATDIEC